MKNSKEWKKVSQLADCPPLNKKVLATHDNAIHMGILEKNEDEGYLWKLINQQGIQWVDLFEVESWIDI